MEKVNIKCRRCSKQSVMSLDVKRYKTEKGSKYFVKGVCPDCNSVVYGFVNPSQIENFDEKKIPMTNIKIKDKNNKNIKDDVINDNFITNDKKDIGIDNNKNKNLDFTVINDKKVINYNDNIEIIPLNDPFIIQKKKIFG
jgi:hypothetical protein